MTDALSASARKTLGSINNGEFTITADEIHAARRGLSQFGSVFSGRGVEAVAFGKELEFDVAITLAPGAGAVVIVARAYRTPSGAMTAVGGAFGTLSAAIDSGLKAGKTSERYDWAQLRRDSLTWNADGSVSFAVEKSAWKLNLDPVARWCLRAWQASSFEELSRDPGTARSVIDALLSYEVATQCNPRTFLAWAPYDSVPAAIAERIGNAEAWTTLTNSVSSSTYGNDFCRNLATVAVPGAHQAAAQLAETLNRHNRSESLMIGLFGVLLAGGGGAWLWSSPSRDLLLVAIGSCGFGIFMILSGIYHLFVGKVAITPKLSS